MKKLTLALVALVLIGGLSVLTKGVPFQFQDMDLSPSANPWSIRCEGAEPGKWVLCRAQITIEVRENAVLMGVWVKDSGKFDLLLQRGRRVAVLDGRVEYEHLISSQRGEASLVFYNPQPGIYYIAIRNHEPSPQNYVVEAGVLYPIPLEPDEPQTGECIAAEPGMGVLCLDQYIIEVTQDTLLRIEVADSGEFALFVRLGKAVEIAQGEIVADWGVPSEMGKASVTIDSKVGAYFIALANFEEHQQSFTITATLGVGKPTASFTFSPQKPKVGETVTFDATASHDPDGFIVWYEWDFGDGSTGFGEKVFHTYTSPGDYTVTLTVSDNDGFTDTETKVITVVEEEEVEEPPPPPPPEEVKVHVLTPNVPLSSTVEAGALLQYTIEIYEGTKSFSVELKGQGNVNLHIRFGKPIEIQNGEIVADLSSISSGGIESIAILAPALQSGTYYIAVENLEDSPQDFQIFATMIPIIVPLVSGESISGRVEGVKVGSRALSTQYIIEVPQGAKRLSISLQGFGNVNLHVRFGEPVKIKDNMIIADFSSISFLGEESLVISRPKPGIYYIIVENLEAFPQEFTITATIE